VSVFWQDGGFVNQLGQPVNEDGTLLNQAKPAVVDTVTRAEYDRVVQDSQTQALQLAEVTTERNEALGREQGKSEEAGRLTEVRDLLTSQLGEVKADLEKKTAEWQTERDDLKQQLTTMTGYRDTAANDANGFRTQIGDLQTQLATAQAATSDPETPAPGDTDQRTKAELKTALDGKGVTYAPNLNRDGLLALAAEHEV